MRLTLSEAPGARAIQSVLDRARVGVAPAPPSGGAEDAVLELEGGARLTDIVAILQYLADSDPDLALRPGTLERYRIAEAMHFVTTEILAAMDFHAFPMLEPAERAHVEHDLEGRWALIERDLSRTGWIACGRETVADHYLAAVAAKADERGLLDRARYPRLSRLIDVMGEASLKSRR